MFRTAHVRAIVSMLALLSVVSVAVPAWAADPTPAKGPASPGGSLAQARTDHTATLLPDGRVLIIGGDNGETLASAEVWSPDTESFSPAGSLAHARKWHTATLLLDGRVLVTGGLGGNGGGQDDFLASAEIWDPDTAAFRTTGSMADSRIHHTATRLADGRVLAVAGVVASIVPLASAELWDPVTGEWTPTGSLRQWRAEHTATELDDGRVLVIGGGSFTSDGFVTFDRAEIWDPASDAFSRAGRLTVPRRGHSATRLTDGRILVLGGSMTRASGEDVHTEAHSSAEVWDPLDRSFDPAGSLTELRGDITSGVLPDGRVLVIGSGGSDSEVSAARTVAESWEPRTESFSPAGTLALSRSGQTVTILPDGRALIVGGVDESGDYLASAEVFEPRSTE